MHTHSHRPLLTAQRLFIVIGLLLVLGLAGAVYGVSSVYQAHAPVYHTEPVPGTPTPYPPRGRRWYFVRPFWLPPEAPQQ